LDKDTECLKIQIIADYYHSTFTAYVSFLFSLVIVWYFTLLTLTFEGCVPFEFFLIFLATGFMPLLVMPFIVTRKYGKKLDKIDKLIQLVNKGELLPSLKELRKKM
jgi:hypothetical protein